MKIFFTLTFLFFSFSETILAKTLYVGSEKEYRLSNYAEIYDDFTQEMGIEEVQKVKWTSVDADELTLTFSSEAEHWFRFNLENNTTEPKSYFLEYDVNTIHFLDVYLLKESIVLQRYLTGAHRPLENRALVYHSFLFPITLKPGEKREIYIRIKHLYHDMPANMTLKEQTTFLLNDYTNNVLQGFFFGIIFMVFFYNFIFYLMTRYTPYLAYTLYLGSFGLWLSLRMGYGRYLFDFMNISFYRYFELSISLLFTVFIIWFITGLLELKKEMPKIYKFLNLVSALFIVIWVNYCLFIFLEKYSYIYYLSNVLFINFLVMNITIFTVTLKLALKGRRIARFLFWTWSLLLLSLIIFTLPFLGLMPYYEWILPLMEVTMVIETVLLSLILGDRYRQQEKVIIQQSRLASMGSMIENIAHQWRQPLSEINADLMAVEIYMKSLNIPMNDQVELRKRIVVIEEKTQMMSDTINDFQDFHHRNKNKEVFKLQPLIDNAVHLNETNFKKYHVSCTVSIEESLKVYGVENEYLQVLMALIQNAVDALEGTDTSKKRIHIDLFKKGDSSVVRIFNNGMKIETSDLERLFEPYFTTKNTTGENSGIGLFMSKKIIEESFDGTLGGSNVKNGVQFDIKVNYV